MNMTKEEKQQKLDELVELLKDNLEINVSLDEDNPPYSNETTLTVRVEISLDGTKITSSEDTYYLPSK